MKNSKSFFTSKLTTKEESRIICPNSIGSIVSILYNFGTFASKVSTRYNLKTEFMKKTWQLENAEAVKEYLIVAEYWIFWSQVII